MSQVGGFVWLELCLYGVATSFSKPWPCSGRDWPGRRRLRPLVRSTRWVGWTRACRWPGPGPGWAGACSSSASFSSGVRAFRRWDSSTGESVRSQRKDRLAAAFGGRKPLPERKWRKLKFQKILVSIPLCVIDVKNVPHWTEFHWTEHYKMAANCRDNIYIFCMREQPELRPQWRGGRRSDYVLCIPLLLWPGLRLVHSKICRSRQLSNAKKQFKQPKSPFLPFAESSRAWKRPSCHK